MSLLAVPSPPPYRDRALVIVDGDNLKGILTQNFNFSDMQNNRPDMRQAFEYIANPDNLGITDVVEIIWYATVANVNSPTYREVSISSLEPIGKTPITLKLEAYRLISWDNLSDKLKKKYSKRNKIFITDSVTGENKIKVGIPDEVMFRRAFKDIGRYDTLICISSDWDFLTFTNRINQGIHPFRRFTHYLPLQLRLRKRRTILIGSQSYAARDWKEAAGELIEIEETLKVLPKTQ